MGKVFDEIDGKLAEWIGGQRMFFGGTAPSGARGHVNLSPKGGIETFRIAGPREVAIVAEDRPATLGQQRARRLRPDAGNA